MRHLDINKKKCLISFFPLKKHKPDTYTGIISAFFGFWIKGFYQPFLESIQNY